MCLQGYPRDPRFPVPVGLEMQMVVERAVMRSNSPWQGYRQPCFSRIDDIRMSKTVDTNSKSLMTRARLTSNQLICLSLRRFHGQETEWD